MKTCVCILTNKDSKIIQDQYDKLVYELNGLHDCHILFHGEEQDLKYIKTNNIFFFQDSILHELGYEPFVDKKLVPGSNHFPILKFAKQHPEYEYFWNVEDDVRFNGNWLFFFKILGNYDCDLMTSNVHRKDVSSTYLWSFNPVFRLSKQAVSSLDYIYRFGKIKGHHEQTMVNALLKSGHDVMDFGGSSKYTPPELREIFYSTLLPEKDPKIFATYRAAVPFESIGDIPNKLYHPVKDF